ncbi:MAG TPA: tetratricopeptide repeat protein [Devosia sp.]|jgi:tetratricopeptide (TPR) repeat protein|nr:tetratricopeptide repeat protein [Devosia sp.]
MRAGGESYGVIGALQAFPLRLATRRVHHLGGRLHRNITRGTTAAVLGRKLLARKDQAEIEKRIAEARDKGVPLLSENGFLRLLRSLPPVTTANITRQSMLEQSGLDGETLDLLALFDAFEHHAEHFSFRDVILAKKYAGLVTSGASWSAIARSVHQIGPVGSLTALTLQADGPARIVAKDAHSLAELDGQRLLPLPEGDEDAEDYFGLAESAEAADLFAEAATLYAHCASIDPTDAVAAFNLGNCLRANDNLAEAATAYITAIKRDPEFVEAWFNYGGVLRALGRVDAARQHLEKAVQLDPTYADAIYNLAALEYEAHDLMAARQWWLRYLELDSSSDWARRARAGVGLANRLLNKVG